MALETLVEGLRCVGKTCPGKVWGIILLRVHTQIETYRQAGGLIAVLPQTSSHPHKCFRLLQAVWLAAAEGLLFSSS